MPVQKFRTFREARLAQWLSPDDPRLYRRIQSWWRISSQFWIVERPVGLQKFRTIEEANAEKEARWRRGHRPE